MHVAGFSVVVVDTNGAGDTHSGVFLAELALGTGVIEAAQRGNAAAAVAISVLGPASCPDARRGHVDDQSFGVVVAKRALA